MSHSEPTSPSKLQESSPQSPQLEPEVTTGKAPGPSAFDQTTQNLLKLGSLTMDKFAQDPSEELDGFDIPLIDPTNPHAAGYYLGDTTRQASKDEDEPDEIPIVPPASVVRFLRDTAQREFGTTSTEPLKYEFLDGLGQNRKACILTITRPNGLSRSYRTKAAFSRKSEAKIAAASSAIQLGAVRFIKRGEASKIVGNRGLVLAKLDAGVKKDDGSATGQSMVAHAVGEGEGEENSADWVADEIEKCSLEWRAGSVIPQWFYITEQKLSNAYGCALKICLSSHIQRAYSTLVSIDYPTKSLAKAACAQVALEQDVLEFIKHGDGLEHPIVVPFVGAEMVPPPAPPSVTTLQAFHAALPKPMPDHIGTKSNGEINAVAWMNNMVQVAKGSRMTVTFNWHTDTKLGLHGCLLRLTRPDAPSQSYLVDAMFSKRADAKLAVCLFACSQGLGDYVRGVAAEIEARVSTAMKRRCTEQILPALGQALNRVRHGLRPEFTYEVDLATFGCTLTIDLTSDLDSETPIKKQWKVPLAYKSKADAKVAVACAAADDGVMDFIKFRGKPPPTPDEDEMDLELDQSDGELEEGEAIPEVGKKKRKKVKKDATADGGESEEADEVDDSKVKGTGKKRGLPLLETKEEAHARSRFDATALSKQQRHLNNRGRGGGFGRPPMRGGFGPRGGIRGGFSQSGFGPDRHRSFGGPPGFPAPHPNFPSFIAPPHPSGIPPHFNHPHSFIPPVHGSGFPAGAYPPGYEHHDRGFLMAEPGPAHERHVHGLGRAGANTTMSFAHAPPPPHPPVVPAYHGYHDREYRQGPHAQPYSAAVPPPPGSTAISGVPPQRPYGYDYSTVAGDARPPPPPPPHSHVPHSHAPNAYHQAAPTEYNYENNESAGRPAQGHSRAYEPGNYAPDYDRIPDRSIATSGQPPVPTLPPPPPHPHGHVALHHPGSAASLHQGLTAPHPLSHSSPAHTHSPHSHSSIAPMQPLPQSTNPHGYGMHAVNHVPPTTHLLGMAYDRPPTQIISDGSHDDSAHGYNTHTHSLQEEQLRSVRPPARPPLIHSEPDTQGHAKIEEELDSVISRLEKEANDKKTTGQPHPPRGPRGWSSTSARKGSFSNTQKPGSPDRHSSSFDQNVKVPIKRGRSPSGEDRNPSSSKRARDRSRSMSRPSERSRSKNGRGGPGNRSVPPDERDTGREKTGSPMLGLLEDGKNARKRAREKSPASQRRKGSEQKDKSYVAALFEHCDKEGLPPPELCHEEVGFGKADKVFKVWIIMGKERLELPTSFPTLNAGQERVAKSVLGRLRVQTKKRKEA